MRQQVMSEAQPKLFRGIRWLGAWWTWSGSNRRSLPCHFSSRTGAERHRQIVRDS